MKWSGTDIDDNPAASEIRCELAESKNRSAKSFRRPAKQIISDLRKSPRRWVQIYVAEHDRWVAKNKERARAADNEDRKIERAAKRDAPRRAIEMEAERQLRMLQLAIKYPHGDKLLEQLGERAGELVKFWTASKASAIATHPRRPSDQDIAKEFTQMSGLPLGRHQARSRRKLINQLEEHPAVWSKI